jgi:hypothetical protein
MQWRVGADPPTSSQVSIAADGDAGDAGARRRLGLLSIAWNPRRASAESDVVWPVNGPRLFRLPRQHLSIADR